MKNILKLDIKWIIIIVLVLFFGIRELTTDRPKKGDKPEIVKVDGEKYEKVKTVVDTVYVTVDSIVYRPGKTIYKEKPIYVDSLIYIEAEVDTSEILREYFAKNVYKDTLYLDDELGVVSVIDTITQNKISNRVWATSINKPTIENTTFLVTPPKNELYYGIVGGLDRNNILSSVGAGLALKTKRDKLYTANIGLINNGFSGTLQPYIGVGAYWKITWKK